MSVPAEFTFFPELRPAAMVLSHERSGTHFLMNALAACYGYVSLPWINLDHPTDSILTYYSRPQICDLLLEMATRPMANVVKSHHPVEFFGEEISRLTKRYTLFVICRHPVDVMLSFWRFMYNFKPEEGFGPQMPEPASFALTPPSGKIVRYHTRPVSSMLARWAEHVRGWHQAAKANPRVCFIRYEDLDSRYEEVMAGLESRLGWPPRAFIRPAKDNIVIRRGPDDPTGMNITPDLQALEKLCRDKVGETMALLGY